MYRYVVLLRGVNVGGKNKLPMADLKRCLEEHGFAHVKTYIQSGNILVDSDLQPKTVGSLIEQLITANFDLDSSVIRVLVLTRNQLRDIVERKPEGFGEQPELYHSDVIFLMGISSKEVLSVFRPREGVDTIWPGEGVVYSRRLSAQRTKSRLSSIVGTPAYQSMTIRNWNTTTKLLALMSD